MLLSLPNYYYYLTKQVTFGPWGERLFVSFYFVKIQFFTNYEGNNSLCLQQSQCHTEVIGESRL